MLPYGIRTAGGQYENEDGELVAVVDHGHLMDTRWGVAQFLGKKDPEKVRERVLETDKYMRDIVMEEEEYDEVSDECKNRYNECSMWAIEGRFCSQPEAKK